MKTHEAAAINRRIRVSEFLHMLGVEKTPPLTGIRDDGMDHLTFESNLNQAAHLISVVSTGHPGWFLAEDHVIKEKISAAMRYSIPIVVGAGMSAAAAAKNRMYDFIDFCSDHHITKIEIDERILTDEAHPFKYCSPIKEAGLEFYARVRVGTRGLPEEKNIEIMIEDGKQWLDSGAAGLLINAEKDLFQGSSFDHPGHFYAMRADALAETFGLHTVLFESGRQYQQQSLLNHFGEEANLYGVGINDLFSVEAIRRGFDMPGNTAGSGSARYENDSAAADFLSTDRRHIEFAGNEKFQQLPNTENK